MIASILLATLAATPCPGDKVLNEPPESVVAGIDIRRNELVDAFRLLGRPGKAKLIRQDGSEPAWAKYKWWRGETAVGVAARGDTLQIVQVSGDPSSWVSGTGRGLTLGDGIERVEALYGRTYVDGAVTGPEVGERTITYCYDDGLELSVGLDSGDRVVGIRLTSPIR